MLCLVHLVICLFVGLFACLFICLSNKFNKLTCVLVVEVSKCNCREYAGKIEEDGGRDGFLKVEQKIVFEFS